MNIVSPIPTAQKPIGQDGRTLAMMLADSERTFKETGRYHGIETLSMKEGDPIRYEKIWSRLRGGLVGARATALNISASPIVREIGELCFALFTPEGDSITLSTGIMAHVHTMSDTIKYLVRNNYEDNPGIAPGDIFVNNDARIGDVHTADVIEILPIFWEGELVAWAAGVTHEIDVGAPQPSSMPLGNVNLFEDGWIISCQKVGANDRLFADYERRCATGVRLPFYWIMDEKCRIAGCQLIRQTVQRLIEEEGVGTFRQVTREFIEDTRRAFKARIREVLIPGVYESPGFIDLPHSADAGRLPPFAAVDTLMHTPFSLRIGPDASFDISIDGASKWGYHSCNASPSSLQGGLWVSLGQILVSNDKVNDGAYLATTLEAPEGCWAKPDNPFASVAMSWAFLFPAFTGLWRSVSQGFAARGYLEEVISAYAYPGNITMGGGPNHYGQEGSWTNFEMSSVGTSAGMVRDGEHSCAAMFNPEGDMGDVEAWELLEPLLYLGRRLRASTAGMGKNRGGSGFESIRLVHNTEAQSLFNGTPSHVFCGNGMFGGYPGGLGYRHVVTDTDMPERIAKGLPYPVSDQDPENSGIMANVKGRHIRDKIGWHKPDEHKGGDVYLSVLMGGHAVGDLIERDPKKVIDDLDGLLLLSRFALSGYGVVASQGADGKWVLDETATAKKRAEIRDTRLARSVPVRDWIAAEKKRVEAAGFIAPVKKMYQESMSLSPKWADKFRKFWGLRDGWMPGTGT